MIQCLLAVSINDWGPTEWAEALIATSLVIGAIWQAATANTKLTTVIQEMKQITRDVRELRRHKEDLVSRIIRLEFIRGIQHEETRDERPEDRDENGGQ